MLLTGIIMKSIVPLSVDLKLDKIMASLGRGFLEKDAGSDVNINIVHWYDMKLVLLASSSL